MAAPRHPRRQGSHRYAEHLRRLAIGKAFDEDERDRLALLARKRVHRPVDLLQLDVPFDVALSIAAERVDLVLRREGAGAAGAAARLVDPAIADDPHRPGVEPGSGLPLVAGLERPLERDLQQVVGVGRIVGERAREPAQPRQQRQQLALEGRQWRLPRLRNGRKWMLPRATG